ncbi:fluoride efflux transporter family protein [Corynebacterium aquilae]|uniref:fluoride efflux transporter family protein n=1 Tax=Corynebacterium aquilae TaxID=203263 RepID=UPI001FE89012|nr:fluoride efflux transporter family protein [Corynebacterium aquilae]
MKSTHIPTAIVAGAGASLGAITRYAVGIVIPGLAGLLIINILGCYAMGRLKPPVFWSTGFLGGFTSFSSYIAVSHAQSITTQVGYLLGTLLLCVAAWLIGDTREEKSAGSKP